MTAPNDLGIPIDVLDGPTPKGPVVKAQALDLLQEAKAVIAAARQEAQAIQRHAHHEALEIQEQAAQLGALEKAKLIREVRSEAHDATVSQALTWLIDQQEFEAAIIKSIAGRVREVIASLLKEWLDDQDQQALLAKRLSALVCQYAQQQRCRLRLCPAEFESLSERLSHLSNLKEIDCVPDAALAAGQAVLDTEFLRIEFDLDRHWEGVLAALGVQYSRSALGEENG